MKNLTKHTGFFRKYPLQGCMFLSILKKRYSCGIIPESDFTEKKEEEQYAYKPCFSMKLKYNKGY